MNLPNKFNRTKSSGQLFFLLSKKQQLYLLEFIKKYNSKRKNSKTTAQKSRPFLCNNRKSSSGFRMETKELTYPIMVSKSNGSKIAYK